MKPIQLLGGVAALIVVIVAGWMLFGLTNPLKPEFRMARTGREQGAVLARTPQELVAAIDALCPVDLSIAPHSEDVRYRHVVVDGDHLYILCNEGMNAVSMEVQVAAQGAVSWVDPWRYVEQRISGMPRISLAPYTTMILRVAP